MVEMLDRIEHTLLRGEAGAGEIEALCREALDWKLGGVCVNPWRVSLAHSLLRGSGVRVVTVVGFPLGATFPAVKALETETALEHGAEEIDMVINLGALKSGQPDLVLQDMGQVVQAAAGRVVKAIIETVVLDREEIMLACRLAQEAGAAFVKTSTGFSRGGATVEDVRLMRQTVGSSMGIKAAGGIRTLAQARELVAAGADRIGTSQGAAIARELETGESPG